MTELGRQLPRITVHNKADALTPRNGAQHGRDGAIWLVSAQTGLGLPRLLRTLEGCLTRRSRNGPFLGFAAHARRDPFCPCFTPPGGVGQKPPVPGDPASSEPYWGPTIGAGLNAPHRKGKKERRDECKLTHGQNRSAPA